LQNTGGKSASGVRLACPRHALAKWKLMKVINVIQNSGLDSNELPLIGLEVQLGRRMIALYQSEELKPSKPDENRHIQSALSAHARAF
jgi:hypothetical protein